jgi:hypothetical protein
MAQAFLTVIHSLLDDTKLTVNIIIDLHINVNNINIINIATKKHATTNQEVMFLFI